MTSRLTINSEKQEFEKNTIKLSIYLNLLIII